LAIAHSFPQVLQDNPSDGRAQMHLLFHPERGHVFSLFEGRASSPVRFDQIIVLEDELIFSDASIDEPTSLIYSGVYRMIHPFQQALYCRSVPGLVTRVFAVIDPGAKRTQQV
jgi:hypothetical protein